MIKCPYCKRDAMSLGQKSGLGPGRAVKCQSCGKLVSAHWTGILAAIPAFLGGFVLLESESAALGIAAVVAGVIVMALVHTFLIPLVRSEQ
jgi:hypothetical protein